MNDEQMQRIAELIEAEKRDALAHVCLEALPGRQARPPSGLASRLRALLIGCGALGACALAFIVVRWARTPPTLDALTVQRALARAHAFETPAPDAPPSAGDARVVALARTVEAALWRGRCRGLDPAAVERVVVTALAGPQVEVRAAAPETPVDPAGLTRRIESLRASGRLQRILRRHWGGT